jgi:hypothetical protein
MPFIRKGIDLFDPKKMKLILRKNARGGSLRDWERVLPADRDLLRRDLQLSNEDDPVVAKSGEPTGCDNTGHHLGKRGWVAQPLQTRRNPQS